MEVVRNLSLTAAEWVSAGQRVQSTMLCSSLTLGRRCYLFFVFPGLGFPAIPSFFMIFKKRVVEM